MTITVMTGATSGIGRVAATRLKARGGRLIAGTREGHAPPPGWEPRPLDLASLASVRAFAASLAGQSIGTLILNAGVQTPTAANRTVDGYETTFAVNHLAHYLLLRLLAPQLAEGARVAITASGTHDPDDVKSIPGPRHADAGLLAHPETDPQLDASPMAAGQRAYSSSKLCNVLTARAFAASPEAAAKALTVIAYDPGLTIGTNLVRAYPWAVRTFVWPLLGVIRFWNPGANRLTDAGRALAELADGTATPPPGRIYAALRSAKLTWPDPSIIARDDGVMRKLWDDSAAMAGL